MNILAPVRPPYPADRLADWRTRYSRVPVEMQIGTEPVADPDAPERSRARFETLIAWLAGIGCVVVYLTR